MGGYLCQLAGMAAHGQVLTLPLGVIIAAVLILIEVLLRLWERSRWKPENPAA
ncbi:MAG TPA: hypothetical protein PLH68_04575 [Anaerolineaceae bacterium]|nr:hypothetical protein [Anaerolineaceae bacterium]